MCTSFQTLPFWKRRIPQDESLQSFPHCPEHLGRPCDSAALKHFPLLQKDSIGMQDEELSCLLCDVKGSCMAQCEHAIMPRPNVKEVVSRGFDC
jgi:hypothetical protein